MIISHKHKFIFIKTWKTAGTSMEIMLRTICGDQDIITPLYPEEQLCKRLGIRRAQNYHVSCHDHDARIFQTEAFKGEDVMFKNHYTAQQIRKVLTNDVWESYFKFCVIRYPLDKIISYYYWMKHLEGFEDTISNFIRRVDISSILEEMYVDAHKKIIIDEMYRYEELDKVKSILAEKYGANTDFFIHAKKGITPSHTSHQQLLTDSDRDYLRPIVSFELDSFYTKKWFD